MEHPRRPRRSAAIDALIAFTVLAPSLFLLHPRSAWGDSSIYFTFFKNFFSQPFCYQPGTVSFGATSPLHVVVHAPIHALFGAHWFVVSQIANFAFIAIGVVLLARAVGGGRRTLLLIAFLTLLCTELLIDAARVYEMGLAFMAVAAIYFLLHTGRLHGAVIAGGAMYLVRPELLLAAIAVDVYAIVKSDRRGRVVVLAALSFAPAAIYHLYMFVATGGELIPSSAYARAVRELEAGLPWSARLQTMLRSFVRSRELVYLAGVMALAFAAIDFRIRRFGYELLLLLPVAFLYVVMPPQKYLIHYLVPLTPIMVVTVVRYFSDEMRALVSTRVIVVLIVLVYGWYAKSFYGHPRFDRDTFLLKNLATKINPIAGPDDRVLIYEIQGQYYLEPFCYSLDSVVGNDLFDVLTGRETFEQFIEAHHVTYVVTMNAFNYRKAFDDTVLEALYSHDLSAPVGGTVERDNVLMRKVLTNEAFVDSTRYSLRDWDGLNNGDEAVRVYGDWNPLWRGHHFLWNSVYEVSPVQPGEQTGTALRIRDAIAPAGAPGTTDAPGGQAAPLRGRDG